MVERYPMTPFVAANGAAMGFAMIRATVHDVALVRNGGPYG